MLTSKPLVGFMPIMFATLLHYLSAVSQPVTWNPEGSLPLGLGEH